MRFHGVLIVFGIFLRNQIVVRTEKAENKCTYLTKVAPPTIETLHLTCTGLEVLDENLAELIDDNTSKEQLVKYKTIIASRNVNWARTVTNGKDSSPFEYLPEMNFSNNTWRELKEGTFKGFENLEMLYLRNNQLSLLHPKCFFPFLKLWWLDLSRNNLTTLHTNIFMRLIKLERLSLDYNQIKKIENGTFTGLQQLSFLNLANNRLENIEADIFNVLGGLHILILNNNNIKTITSEFQLEKVTVISLIQNHLVFLSPDVFDDCVELNFIRLSGNKLRRLTDRHFNKLSKLKEISVDKEAISNNNFPKETKYKVTILE